MPNSTGIIKKGNIYTKTVSSSLLIGKQKYITYIFYVLPYKSNIVYLMFGTDLQEATFKLGYKKTLTNTHNTQKKTEQKLNLDFGCTKLERALIGERSNCICSTKI